MLNLTTESQNQKHFNCFKRLLFIETFIALNHGQT